MRTLRATGLQGLAFALLLIVACAGGTQSRDDRSSGRAPAASGALPSFADLAGRRLDRYPWWTPVETFDPSSGPWVGIDGAQQSAFEVDLYLVAPRSREEWQSDRRLVDVRGNGAQRLQVPAGGLKDRRFEVTDLESLPRFRGDRVGSEWSLVLDFDRDGLLDETDRIDPTFYLTPDLTVRGPRKVAFFEHRGGAMKRQRIHYPLPRAGEEPKQLPLLVISHGYTHQPEYYDYLGKHLASYGTVVMAHTNDVGRGDHRGTETASLSTLANTDHLLASLATIGNGALDGQVDPRRIAFLGHSTGGEGVVRAHARLRLGETVPEHFGVDDVVWVVSFCPVSFLESARSTPDGVPYHIWIGGADTDTSGAPVGGFAQSMILYERATGPKGMTVIQNSGHEWFHDKPDGDPLAEGPDLAGREAVHSAIRSLFAAHAEWALHENRATKEYLTRSLTEFRPAGIDAKLLLSSEFHPGRVAEGWVIDDFESEPSLDRSSSGEKVTARASSAREIVMEDQDGSFEFRPTLPANGMTRARPGDDTPRCLVLEWGRGEVGRLSFALPESRPLHPEDRLRFRVCQGTRHPHTVQRGGPLSFTVSLVDSEGRASRVRSESYGEVVAPYPRAGFGRGTGWGNEFTSFEIPVGDFTADRRAFDLSSVVAVQFEFGEEFGSARGRVGFDDLSIGPRDPQLRGSIVRPLAAQPRFAAASVPTTVRAAVTGKPSRVSLSYQLEDRDGRVTAGGSLPMLEESTGRYRADLPPGAEHHAVSYSIAATDAEGIVTHAPASAPRSRYRLEVADEETIAEADLDIDPGWSATGSWEFGVPQGKGGGPRRGFPDPTAGATGARVYGIALDGNHGSSTERQDLIAGPFDLRGWRAIQLSYHRWLNTDARRWVHASVAVSAGGDRWTTLWENGNENIEDDHWVRCTFDLDDSFDGAEKLLVRFRFQLRVSDAWQMSGWNVDDLRLVGVRMQR